MRFPYKEADNFEGKPDSVYKVRLASIKQKVSAKGTIYYNVAAWVDGNPNYLTLWESEFDALVEAGIADRETDEHDRCNVVAAGPHEMKVTAGKPKNLFAFGLVEEQTKEPKQAPKKPTGDRTCHGVFDDLAYCCQQMAWRFGVAGVDDVAWKAGFTAFQHCSERGIPIAGEDDEPPVGHPLPDEDYQD